MFKFKGISSKEMDVYVTEIDNLIRKAPQRYEEIYIDGRDGAFFHPLGYSPIEVPLELTLMKPERIDEVLQWLNGTGWLEYNGRKTKAHIFSEVEPVRASTVRIIQVTIIRNPFWEGVEDDWEEAWGVNLIENGWDDFEPYGSGKNYVENWNFESDELEDVWQSSLGRSALEIKNNKLVFTNIEGNNSARIHLNLNIPIGEYMLRFKVKNNNGVLIKDPIGINHEEFSKGEGNYVVEMPFKTTHEEVRLRIFSSEKEDSVKGDFLEIDWIQITPLDNQHLVVEKTPLGNGMTRIQTWGGNNRLKLMHRNTNEVSVYNVSFNITPAQFIELWTSSGSESSAICKPSAVSQHVSLTENKVISDMYLRVFSENWNGSLDFIASDPQIVEGDTVPNWQATSNPAIYNEGTATSKPLIKLEKGNDRQCEFEVNGTYFKFHFNDDDHVILDCEEMEATYNGFNRNRHLTIGFEWPKLKPKENFVKRISGDAKISFKRKDRWL